MVVHMAGGASTSDAIVSAAVDESDGAQPGSERVPRWALDPDRALAADDVLAFVARSWQVVMVGPAPRGGEAPADIFAGSVPEHLLWLDAPVVRADGTGAQTVPACLVGEPQRGEPPAPVGAPVTLAGCR